MTSFSDQFKQRVEDTLLPVFRDDPARQLRQAALVDSSRAVSEIDARDFLRALDSGLVYDIGGGRYRAPRSNANEQLFWEGRRAKVPRRLSLWLEPVITIAAVARLHFDLGWSRESLGMQSKGYAFDVMAYDGERPVIAGEVKKSVKEVDNLLMHLDEFARLGSQDAPARADKRLNAFRKGVGLIQGRVPFFWVVGPAGYAKAFRMEYLADGTALLHPLACNELTPQTCL